MRKKEEKKVAHLCVAIASVFNERTRKSVNDEMTLSLSLII